jgi:hypothetical protein
MQANDDIASVRSEFIGANIDPYRAVIGPVPFIRPMSVSRRP